MVENNNNETGFMQIWPDYIYSDKIKAEPPAYKDFPKTVGSNPDGTSYIKYDVSIGDDSDDSTRPYLIYVEDYQLTKEFRQSNKILKFDGEFDEEYLRRVIFPGTTTTRGYAPTFRTKVGDKYSDIPYTFLNPEWDLENCRIKVDADIEVIYFSGWFYVGGTLADMYTPPFDDRIWLLQNEDGVKAKFHITNDTNKSYNLPKTDMEGFVEKDSTLVTHETINTVLNTIGELDGGRYW